MTPVILVFSDFLFLTTPILSSLCLPVSISLFISVSLYIEYSMSYCLIVLYHYIFYDFSFLWACFVFLSKLEKAAEPAWESSRTWDKDVSIFWNGPTTSWEAGAFTDQIPIPLVECCPRDTDSPALLSGAYKANKLKLPELGRRLWGRAEKAIKHTLEVRCWQLELGLTLWNCLPLVCWTQRWDMSLWCQYQKNLLVFIMPTCKFLRAGAVLPDLVPYCVPNIAPDIWKCDKYFW